MAREVVLWLMFVSLWMDATCGSQYAGYEHPPPVEMIEDGRRQYELLREQAKLPRYGECWKSAVQRVHKGCSQLSEESQSDMTLHVTNCFLEMSGHETYNCELDRKPNLRRYCISMMSDRAFNAYTQFYTHMQNICWFIRGQLWQERILEGTSKMSEQLASSVAQQRTLLAQQRESLDIQQRLLDNGRLLQRVLNESRVQAERTAEELRASVLKHQRLLGDVAEGLSGLHAWLVGEVSWLDTFAFYLAGGVAFSLLTATVQTARARLPTMIALCLQVLVERSLFASTTDRGHYVWWCRYATLALNAAIVVACALNYRDLAHLNHSLLLDIRKNGAQLKEVLLDLNGPNAKNDVPVLSPPATPTSHVYNLRHRSSSRQRRTPDPR